MSLPPLDPRFLQPDGWQWGTFERTEGRRLRYGFVAPEAPKAILIFLPGLNDFCEKYFEFAQWALSQDYGIFILDWFGQGKSGRYLENPHKRHAGDFNEDIADCAHWIEQIIRPQTQAPLVLAGHSMGGNLGLHILHRYPDLFACAAFIAPMFGIKTLRFIPNIVISSMNKLMGESYVLGGTDWNKRQHLPAKLSFLTRDPDRNLIDNAWAIADSEIQVGAVTYGWVYRANQSCRRLQALDFSTIRTHCLIATAEHEILVDNRVTRKIAARLPNVTQRKIEDSYHEPLMARDPVRNQILDELHHLVDQCLQDGS